MPPKKDYEKAIGLMSNAISDIEEAFDLVDGDSYAFVEQLRVELEQWESERDSAKDENDGSCDTDE